MVTKIKYITASEFLEVTADGIIDLATTRQLIVDIAKAEHPPADHELLIDLRDTTGHLSVSDVYQIAAELGKHGDTFRRKVALLVVPGINFERASFLETCSHNRGFSVNAFTDFETAMRWVLAPDDHETGTAAAQKDDPSKAAAQNDEPSQELAAPPAQCRTAKVKKSKQ